MITYMTFLMHKKAGVSATWEKLIDIKDFPDLGGEPEMIETTTLSDRMKTYEPGIQDVSSLQFTAAYSLDKYKELKGYDNTEKDYSVWLGGTENSDGTVTPTGSGGKFTFKGKSSTYKSGGGTNEHQEMIITIAPTSVITLEED